MGRNSFCVPNRPPLKGREGFDGSRFCDREGGMLGGRDVWRTRKGGEVYFAEFVKV